MKTLLLFILATSISLFAADSCANPGTTYLASENKTGTDVTTFKKICITDADGVRHEIFNIRGGVKTIGTPVMCKGANGICVDPGAGVQNNDISNANMIMADYDDNSSYGISATEAAKTTTSSMAHLTLKSSAKVVWAKLYWMARHDDTTSKSDYDSNAHVKFLTPHTSGQYKDITCTHYGKSTIDPTAYCSAEVTADVNASGDYWVGDVNGTDKRASFAAWALFIVYEDETETLKNVSLYEGFDYFYNSSLSIPISGFVTPRDGTVNATFHVFSGESDDGYNDHVDINNKAGTPIRLHNPVGHNYDFLNASIENYGIQYIDRLPNFVNAMGIDVDSVSVVDDVGTPILGNEQTATTIKFTSNGDLLYIPVLGFSTELFEPNFCYDYAYKQDNRYFTEENNGTLDPTLVGTVSTASPVEMTLYVRNREADIPANNVVLTVRDINTTQAVRDTSFLEKTNPGDLAYNPATATSSTTSGFSLKLADTILANQGVYTVYKLNPIQSTLNMPIDAYVDYDITYLGNTFHYSKRKLNSNIPLCTSGDYTYVPEWGIINVLDSNENKSKFPAGTGLIYNLYTQVSKRPFAVEIGTFDANNLNTPKATKNFIGIELIDAGGFQDINSSCDNPKNSISEIVWMPFHKEGFPDQNTTNRTFDFNYIQSAINNHYTTLTNPNDFYGDVREGVAFRTWYLVNTDNNDTPFDYTYSADGQNVIVNFFPSLSGQECGGGSVVPYAWNADGSVKLSSNKANVVCGNAGSTGIPVNQFAACVQCIKGRYAKPLCSRDNFTIRPEAFKINIYDINHTATAAVKDSTKVAISNNEQLSADYNYRFDINATTHISDEGAVGYSLNFLASDPSDRNVTFIWEPLSGGLNCNDTTSKSPDFYMTNGVIKNEERNNSNVGRYRLSMIDQAFTKRDYVADHHVPPYFHTAPDCLLNSDIVPSSAVAITNSNVGCNITSNHTNEDNTSLSTTDYNLTFVPYDFDISTVFATVGKDSTPLTALPADALLYMSDLNKSTLMSLRYSGSLRAVGEGNSSLTNFVDHCYATDITLSLDHNLTTASATVPMFQFKYVDSLGNRGVRDMNTTKINFMTIDSTRFQKANQGSIPFLNLSFNYERNISKPMRIQSLHIGNLSLACKTPSECQSQADLSASPSLHTPDSDYIADSNLTFAYARVHAPRYRINGNSGQTKLYYEVYCDAGAGCSNYNLTQESVDDVNWYINPKHTSEALFGSLLSIQSSAHPTVTSFPSISFSNGIKDVNATYDGSLKYPFKSKVLLTPDPWLIFNPFDSNATSNSYMVEFFNNNASWTGTIKATQSVDGTASKTTNRRVNW